MATFIRLLSIVGFKNHFKNIEFYNFNKGKFIEKENDLYQFILITIYSINLIWQDFARYFLMSAFYCLSFLLKIDF